MPAWTTKEQYEHLLKEVAAYRAVGGRKFNKQWPGLYQWWFQIWLERKVVFKDLLEEQPGLGEDDPLTEEQSQMLANAIGNNCNAGCGGMLDLLQLKSHIKKHWEIYAKEFYHECVKSGVTAGSSIDNLQAAIEEAFRNETPEVIEHKKNQDSDEDDEVSDSETDLLALQKNINQCGPTLQHILEHLRWKTGLHVGQNKYGNDFSEACPKFDTEVVNAYVEFLLNVFDKGRPEAPGIKEKSKMVGAEDDNNTSDNKSNHSDEDGGEGGEDGEGEGDGEGEVDDVPSHPTVPYVADSPTIPTSDAAGPMQNFATPMQNVAGLMQNFAPPMQNSAAPPPIIGAGYSPPWDQPGFEFSSLMGSDMLNYNTFAPHLGTWNGGQCFTPSSESGFHFLQHAGGYAPYRGPSQGNHYSGNYSDDFTLSPSSSPTPSGQNHQAPLELMPSVLGMQFTFGNVQGNPTGVIQPRNQLSPPAHSPNSIPSSPSMLPTNPHMPAPLRDIPMLPVPPCPPTEPCLINLPQMMASNTVIDSSAGMEGHSKCKHVPSQHAQHDNAIGDIGKENHIPIPAERSTKPKKNVLKRSAPSDVEEGPAKKTSKCVMPSEAKDGSKTKKRKVTPGSS
ncbi:hypothetical protein BDN67DRAFT_1017214 [Paxillus ammoniavirescens]|nr:hypothetical protein BDN67DRAFT_1017214 [Paxillus ammoniavirescens]